LAYNEKTLLVDANGNPIPQYYDTATDSFKPLDNLTELEGSRSQIPVDVQARYSKTIQTHNAVSVVGSGNTTRVEVSTKGYSKGVIAHSGNPGSCQARAQVVLSNGTLVGGSTVAVTGNSFSNHTLFDLNGVEKISVYGTDTSAASNAITIEVYLMV
jgi:hypothetical protein